MHYLLYATSGAEVLGTWLEGWSLPLPQQMALLVALAIFVPATHQCFEKAIA